MKSKCLMIRSSMTAFVIAMLMVAAAFPISLNAQTFYGSIVGSVTDSSGAVVPAASILGTNMGTGQTVKTQTDADGKYSLVDLLPATYKIEVDKTGFKRTEREHVQVEVGAVARIDVSLAVGAANETVVVTTATPLLQTDTSSLSQEVEGNVVQQMPLNGRNVMNLIELAPGVIPAGASSGSAGLDQSTGRTAGGLGWNNYEIGGAIQGWSADYIDGVPNQLYGDNILALIPTQDAVQEFNVISSDATADYGRFAGGVVTMTTKSGTNAFHGSAYEYLRNADFNANSWFSNQNGIARAKWNQNQYGVAATGPIKRDKAFFMFSWENSNIITAVLNTDTVATAAMQNGLIPEVYNSAGVLQNSNVVDPLGNCNIKHNAGSAAAPGNWTITNLYGPGLNGGTCGDPLNEVLKQYYPLPNVNAKGYNWILSAPLTNSTIQYNGRVDYNISSKQRFFARYSWWKVTDGFDSVFGDIGSPAFGSTTPTTWPTAPTATHITTQQGVLGDTYTLNPTTVLDARVSATREIYVTALQNQSVNEVQFDQYNPNKYYTALAPQMPAGLHVLPDTTVSGVHSLFTFGSLGQYDINVYNTYSLNASLVKILGSHSLKFGAEARLMDNSGTPTAAGAGGYYTYSTAFAGDEWAAFLMGYPEGGKAAYFQTFQETAGYSYYQGYYVMDDWQATHKLTLNLGLRYELPGAPAERNNRLAVLLPNTFDPYTGITGTEAPVASALYHPRTAIIEQYNLFAPRLGFAYRATGNTVLHGGYGLSYIPNDLSGVNGYGTLPFLSSFNAATTSAPAPSTATPLSQPIVNTKGATVQPILACIVNGPSLPGCSGYAKAGLIQPSPVPAANFMTSYGSTTSYKGQIIAAPYPYQPYPYVQQWNVGLSHQFKGDWMAGVTYSGLKGTNLPQIGYPPHTYFSLDELSSQYYSKGYNVTGGTASPTALNATSSANDGIGGCPKAPALEGIITVGQCLRPNPYYSDVEDTARWAAHQSFKSAQFNAEKRFGSGGGLLMANYTWSKNMADTDEANQQLEVTPAPRTGDGIAGLQDYNNPGAEYSLISYDVKNRFVLDYELNLPFGRGQKYANNFSGAANAIASGWAINGITIFQSGFPIFFQSNTTNFLTSNMGAGILRPNVVPGCNKKVSGGSQTRVLAGAWFNTNCFVTATSSSDPTGQVTFGDEPRVDPDLRADGIKNFDFAFQKSTPIWESSSFVFRAEFFNIMNRVQFAPPVNTYGSSTFGEVISQANHPRQIQLSARVNF